MIQPGDIAEQAIIIGMTASASSAALLVSGLCKAYADVVAVDGLDLEVRRGECFGLLGPNGAGKTTTIEICEGLTTPDSGDVEVLGMRWASQATLLRERLGIQLQDTQLSDKLTVVETLRLFRSFYPRGASADDLIALMHLNEKRDSRVGNLSGGQKQRLTLACALAGDPELLFLDEPTTGLDPQARRQLWDVIESLRRQGRTIVLTTHYMDEAEKLCDRVAIMDHGRRIALGTPRELVASIGGRHGGEQLVDFSTGGADVNADRLRALDGVMGVTVDEEGSVRVQAGELHRVIPALLDEVERQGIALTELRTHSATLEDVFVSLTGRRLREE